MAVNSFGVVPPAARAPAIDISKALLLFAATAMRSDLALILRLGWRAGTPIIFATGASFLAAAAIALSLAP